MEWGRLRVLVISSRWSSLNFVGEHARILVHHCPWLTRWYGMIIVTVYCTSHTWMQAISGTTTVVLLVTMLLLLLLRWLWWWRRWWLLLLLLLCWIPSCILTLAPVRLGRLAVTAPIRLTMLNCTCPIWTNWPWIELVVVAITHQTLTPSTIRLLLWRSNHAETALLTMDWRWCWRFQRAHWPWMIGETWRRCELW